VETIGRHQQVQSNRWREVSKFQIGKENDSQTNKINSISRSQGTSKGTSCGCHGGKTVQLSATHTIVLRTGHRTRTGNWNSESLKADPRYAGLLFPIPGHTLQRSFRDGNAAAVNCSSNRDHEQNSDADVALSNKARRARGHLSCQATRPSKDLRVAILRISTSTPSR
jgi:hypothetical protein